MFEIEELKKADGVDCVHLCKNGCTIYKDRPKTCKDFRCLWLDNHIHNGKLAYRPDKLGIVLLLMENPPFTDIVGVFRVDRGPLSPKAKGLLRDMEAKMLYFFEEKLYGPQKLIDEWKRAYKVD